MTPPHDQPRRQVEPKTRWGEQSAAWGLIAVLVIVLLIQATKKISSSHRTATDSMPIVYVTPPPGEKQPSPSETTETTEQR